MKNKSDALAGCTEKIDTNTANGYHSPMFNTKQAIGFTQLALAQCIIGANIVLAKILLPVIPVYLLLALRFMVGSLILTLVCFFKKENPLYDLNNNRLQPKDWLVLFAQALCAGFLFNIFILSGLHYTDASTAGIISSITPAVIALLSFFIIKEKLGPRRIIAIMLAVTGLLVISVGKVGEGVEKSSWLGDLLVLIAVFPEALFTVIAKWYKINISSYSTALIINIVNMILFFPFVINAISSQIALTINYTHILLILLYGLFGGALFFIFWYKGLENNSASIAAIFTALMPISTTVLAYYFLNENISYYDIAGIMLVIMSIILGAAHLKKIKFKGFILND